MAVNQTQDKAPPARLNDAGGSPSSLKEIRPKVINFDVDRGRPSGEATTFCTTNGRLGGTLGTMAVEKKGDPARISCTLFPRSKGTWMRHVRFCVIICKMVNCFS